MTDPVLVGSRRNSSLRAAVCKEGRIGGAGTADDRQSPARGKQALAAISEALVSLHREYYGKGPTKAKTFLVDDTVLCLLQGGFTVVEKTLIDNGREQAVHDIRRTFQAAMEQRFTSVVEQALDRKVIAYMSQVHNDPDLSAELFVLEKVGGDGPLAEEHELDVSGSD